jgi:hypothetical protein
MAESDARPRPPAGWDAHPEVKAVCKPVLADDGLFWLTDFSNIEICEHIIIISLCHRFLCATDFSAAPRPGKDRLRAEDEHAFPVIPGINPTVALENSD